MPVWHPLSISAAVSFGYPFTASEQQPTGPGGKEVRDLTGTALSACPTAGHSQLASSLSHQSSLECSLSPAYKPQGDRRKGIRG